MKTKKVRLKSGEYRFKVFHLDPELEDSSPPIPAVLGDPAETWNLYRDEISAFQAALGPEYVQTPFSFPQVGNRRFGDFTSAVGQREFRQVRLALHQSHWRLERRMQDLRRFADLAQVIRFPKSEECACVRDFSFVADKPTFTIGQGPYEEVFATMNSQGLRFEINDRQLIAVEVLRGVQCARELKKLSALLTKRHGAVTVRKAIHDHVGGLPQFSHAVASYVIGTASLILTSDGDVVFGRRAKKRVSVNVGVSVPTSGGCKYDRQILTKLGLPRFLEFEILRESEEETGIIGSDCSVTVLAFVRELSRAGSPEVLAVIEFFGTLRELVGRMRANQNPDQDIDAVFALPLNEARKLVREPDAMRAAQPKALATMIMLDRFLKNGLA